MQTHKGFLNHTKMWTIKEVVNVLVLCYIIAAIIMQT